MWVNGQKNVDLAQGKSVDGTHSARMNDVFHNIPQLRDPILASPSESAASSIGYPRAWICDG